MKLKKQNKRGVILAILLLLAHTISWFMPSSRSYSDSKQAIPSENFDKKSRIENNYTKWFSVGAEPIATPENHLGEEKYAITYVGVTAVTMGTIAINANLPNLS